MIAAAQVCAALKSYSIVPFYARDADHQVSMVKEPPPRKVIDKHSQEAPMAPPGAEINPPSKQSIPQDIFGFDDESAAVTNPVAACSLPAHPAPRETA